MKFYFYPKHEYSCPCVRHCPHLGGAALGTLVHVANSSDEIQHRQRLEIDRLRQECDTKYVRIVKLQQQVEQLKLELRVERQSKFATQQQLAAGVPITGCMVNANRFLKNKSPKKMPGCDAS